MYEIAVSFKMTMWSGMAALKQLFKNEGYHAFAA